MKLLVTGGAGFIGSAFIRQAIPLGYEILNIDCLTYASCLENLSSIDTAPEYSFINIDLRDKSKLSEIVDSFNPDAVIHFAAETHVDRSIDSPINFIETNIIGTYNLLESSYKNCIKRNKLSDFRFLHISTDEVYGDILGSARSNEKFPYLPSSPYSASKASSDHLINAYVRTHSINAVISNCSNNYGPFQFPEKLIPLFINNIVNNKPLPVYGKGENVRDWLYVEDHVRAIDVIFHKGKVGDTYNIGGFNEWKNIDLIKVIIRTVDQFLGRKKGTSEKLITYLTDRAGHDLRYAIDSSKLKNELGWEPALQFEEGIEKTVKWYLDNKDWLREQDLEYLLLYFH